MIDKNKLMNADKNPLDYYSVMKYVFDKFLENYDGDPYEGLKKYIYDRKEMREVMYETFLVRIVENGDILEKNMTAQDASTYAKIATRSFDRDCCLWYLDGRYQKVSEYFK